MRSAHMAVLLLLTVGCGGETIGTVATEPSHVATKPGAPEPATGSAAPATPQSEPAAAPGGKPPAPRATPAAKDPHVENQTAAAPVSSVASPAVHETPTSGPTPAVTPPVATQPAATQPVSAQPADAPAAPAAPAAVPAPQPIAAAAAAPAPETPAVVESPAAVPEMDLKALKDRLRQTKAIGLMTKLTLKNQVDDLMDRFREHYRGKAMPTMKELRRSYDLLMMKVLSLLQDEDQQLASAIVASREAIWGLLADPVKFETLQG
ncbi:MAG: hypothetical protein ABIV06_01520 [Thermoanaerobaculia bacterium]